MLIVTQSWDKGEHGAKPGLKRQTFRTEYAPRPQEPVTESWTTPGPDLLVRRSTASVLSAARCRHGSAARTVAASTTPETRAGRPPLRDRAGRSGARCHGRTCRQPCCQRVRPDGGLRQRTFRLPAAQPRHPGPAVSQAPRPRAGTALDERHDRGKSPAAGADGDGSAPGQVRLSVWMTAPISAPSRTVILPWLSRPVICSHWSSRHQYTLGESAPGLPLKSAWGSGLDG